MPPPVKLHSLLVMRLNNLRRLGTLQRCIQNVYSLYPPERSDIPSRDENIDLVINLQAFVFNVFGCIDNLAWVWVVEKQLTLRPIDVSFSKKKPVRKTLSTDFKVYLDGLENWFEYLEDFRHALAHRIPLYVPPYTVIPANADRYIDLNRQMGEAVQRLDFNEYDRLDAEQTLLGKFTPAMTHSLSKVPGGAGRPWAAKVGAFASSERGSAVDPRLPTTLFAGALGKSRFELDREAKAIG
jgi:hypothetical protein